MPETYRRHPEAGDLPEKTDVWLVQNSGKRFSGAISSAYRFEGGWDDESLVAGCCGKSYPHTAIGRHGNFLQWGFDEPPSKMTEDGRKLLVNCICYITRFAGRPPLTRRQTSNRRSAFALRAFADELAEQYEGREEELYQLHKDNIELMRYQQKRIRQNVYALWFPIDFELKSLGIASNRRVSTLERLISLLEADRSASDRPDGFLARWMARRAQAKRQATALKLLKRYTNEDFDTKAQWQRWLDANRDRLFFSDFGGYKFYVAPERYCDIPRPPANEGFRFPR